MGLINLTQELNNKLTIVNLPKVSLCFSYEVLIALVYDYNKKERLFVNNEYLNYSITTSKHINKIKQLTNLKPIWKTEDQINKMLIPIVFP